MSGFKETLRNYGETSHSDIIRRLEHERWIRKIRFLQYVTITFAVISTVVIVYFCWRLS